MEIYLNVFLKGKCLLSLTLSCFTLWLLVRCCSYSSICCSCSSTGIWIVFV